MIKEYSESRDFLVTLEYEENCVRVHFASRPTQLLLFFVSGGVSKTAIRASFHIGRWKNLE